MKTIKLFKLHIISLTLLAFIFNCSQADIFTNANTVIRKSMHILALDIMIFDFEGNIMEEYRLPKGLQRGAVAIGNYNDLTMENLTEDVTWNSSDPSVADIIDDGYGNRILTAIDVGESVISASMDGVTSNEILMTVTPAVIQHVVVSPNSYTVPLDPPGLTRQFNARGYFSDGTDYDITDQVEWISGDPAVATISNSAGSEGEVTPLSGGSSVITAIYDNEESDGSNLFNVDDSAINSITVSPSTALKPLGMNQQFTATANYDSGRTYNITGYVTWYSSNTGIATVNTNGYTTSISSGLVQITADYGIFNDSANFEIDSVIYVGTTGDDAANDGTSSRPFATIGRAIDVAIASMGMEIHVALGDYNDSIQLKEDVSLLGGYSADYSTRDPENNLTAISASGASVMDPVAIIGDNTISNATIVDGFVIYGGDGTFPDTRAIQCGSQCSPVIQNNRIHGGMGIATSTGIYCSDAVNPVIRNNLIDGGAGQTSIGIQSYNSSALIRNNTIHGGSGTAMSIGIQIEEPGTIDVSVDNPTIQNNIIFCSGSTSGYGIFEVNNNSDPVHVENNNIFDCSGGLYHDVDTGLDITGIRDGNLCEPPDETGTTLATPFGSGNVATFLINDFTSNISRFVNLKGNDNDINTWDADGTQSWALSDPAEPTVADGGLDLSMYFDTDFTGNPVRTFPWSIGAYENDTSGLVAFYPFNGDADDWSGYGNNGAILDNGQVTSANDRFGNAGNAYNFQGADTNSAIEVSPSTNVLPTADSSRTISIWVLRQGGQDILYYGPISPSDYKFCGISYINPDIISYYGGNTAAENYNITYTLPSTIWTQITAVYEYDTNDSQYKARIYIDGVQTGSYGVMSAWDTANEVLWIGKSYLSNYFQGALDEVRIYNRALTAEEVANIYAMERY